MKNVTIAQIKEQLMSNSYESYSEEFYQELFQNYPEGLDVEELYSVIKRNCLIAKYDEEYDHTIVVGLDSSKLNKNVIAYRKFGYDFSRDLPFVDTPTKTYYQCKFMLGNYINLLQVEEAETLEKEGKKRLAARQFKVDGILAAGQWVRDNIDKMDVRPFNQNMYLYMLPFSSEQIHKGIKIAGKPSALASLIGMYADLDTSKKTYKLLTEKLVKEEDMLDICLYEELQRSPTDKGQGWSSYAYSLVYSEDYLADNGEERMFSKWQPMMAELQTSLAVEKALWPSSDLKLNHKSLASFINLLLDYAGYDFGFDESIEQMVEGSKNMSRIINSKDIIFSRGFSEWTEKNCKDLYVSDKLNTVMPNENLHVGGITLSRISKESNLQFEVGNFSACCQHMTGAGASVIPFIMTHDHVDVYSFSKNGERCGSMVLYYLDNLGIYTIDSVERRKMLEDGEIHQVLMELAKTIPLYSSVTISEEFNLPLDDEYQASFTDVKESTVAKQVSKLDTYTDYGLGKLFKIAS